MAARPTPYQQGDLDGLCGIYAIINALRAICREINDELAVALFRELGQRLRRKSPPPVSALTDGMDGHLLRVLLNAARKLVRQELEIRIRARELELTRTLALASLWGALANELDGDAVAIAMTEGAHDHWTVAYRVTPRTLQLLDSSHSKLLLRSRCTVGQARTRYRLCPTEIIVLKRY